MNTDVAWFISFEIELESPDHQSSGPLNQNFGPYGWIRMEGTTLLVPESEDGAFVSMEPLATYSESAGGWVLLRGRKGVYKKFSSVGLRIAEEQVREQERQYLDWVRQHLVEIEDELVNR